MSKGKRMASRAEMKENKRKRRQAKKAGKMLRTNNKRSRRYEPKSAKRKSIKRNTRPKKQKANRHNTRTNTKTASQIRTSKNTTPNSRTSRTQSSRTSRRPNQTRNHSSTRKPTYSYSSYYRHGQKRKINMFRVFMALLILVTIIATPIYFITRSKQSKEATVSTPEPDLEQSPEPTQEPSVEPSPEETETPENVGRATMNGIEGVEDEQIKELMQTTMAEKGLTEKNFAFFYYNINEKKYYFYNENKYMTGASMVKMPVAMLYYDMLKRGEITLEDKIEYKKDSYEPGAGATASMYKVGEKVPIKYLLEQSIINSDNTANNILISKFGYEEYRKAVAEYATTDLPEEFYEKNIMSARYAYDVCNHLYNNMQDYQGLIEYLKKSSHGSYLKKYLTNTDVAHKYGSYENCEHDYGIVFGKNTYLIGVLTDGVKNSEELISQISLDVFKLEEK